MSKNPAIITAGSIPKYRQLLLILRKQILTGELPAGARLPSEDKLCNTYQLSRGTIRRAIAQLEAERLVSTQHGVGSFVRSTHPSTIPFHFATPTCATVSDSVTYKVLAQDIVTAPMHIIEELALPPGSKVIHIARQQISSDQVIAYSERYLPEEIMPSIMQEDLTKVAFLHDLLVSHSEFPLLRAEVQIEAQYINEEEAALLDAEAGIPAIIIKRKTFTAPNRPAVWYFGLYKQEYNLSVLIGG